MPQALLFYALSLALLSLFTIKYSLLINFKDAFLYYLANFTEGKAISLLKITIYEEKFWIKKVSINIFLLFKAG